MINEVIALPVVGGEVKLSAYVPDVVGRQNGPVVRPAVVVVGGGGYAYVSDREAEPIALRLAAYGINAYTVIYRTAPDVRYPRPVQDVAAAVAWVRAHAAAHHTDPDHIAVMGFSAGGHAAANLGVTWQQPEMWQELGLTPEMVKPNAMVLCYPVINAGEKAHRGSFENLTGSQNIADHQCYSLDEKVTADAPRTFLWATWDDGSVPV